MSSMGSGSLGSAGADGIDRDEPRRSLVGFERFGQLHRRFGELLPKGGPGTAMFADRGFHQVFPMALER